jgi:prepilin-type processing-associated H-X9-DG protein
LAFHNYHSQHDCFPPGQLARPNLSGSWSVWAMRILPFLEESALYNSFNHEISFLNISGNGNNQYFFDMQHTSLHTTLYKYICPSDSWGYSVRYDPTGWSLGNYVATYSPDGTVVEPGANFIYDTCFNNPNLNPAKRRALSNINVTRGIRYVSDGTSNTVCVSEVISDPDGTRWTRGAWWDDFDNYSHLRNPNTPIPDSLWWNSVALPGFGCDPRKAPCDETAACWSTQVYSARSQHPGGVNVLLTDGSVRFAKNTIDLATWQAIASINAGEVISSNAW